MPLPAGSLLEPVFPRRRDRPLGAGRGILVAALVEPMSDLVHVAVTVAVFGVIALVARGVEKL